MVSVVISDPAPFGASRIISEVTAPAFTMIRPLLSKTDEFQTAVAITVPDPFVVALKITLSLGLAGARVPMPPVKLQFEFTSEI